MSRTLVKRFVTVAIIIILIYTVWLAFSDFKNSWHQITLFNWPLLPPALLLVLINFTLREVKWNWFRLEAGIDVPRRGSALIFFSGYSMCISPGRVGELIKPFMLKDIFNIWYRHSVPLLFCERLTDLLGMIVLCLATIGFYLPKTGLHAADASGDFSVKYLIIYLFCSAVLMAAIIGLIRRRNFVEGTFAWARKFAPAKIVEKFENLYRSTYPLLTAKALTLMTTLAVCSWFFECWGVWVLCKGLGIADQVSLANVIFIFCISSIIGGLVFTPGGVGGFEATMIFLLSLLGVAAAQYTAFTFLTRICTLFYGAAIGFLVLFVTSKIYHKNILADMDHLQEELSSEQLSVSSEQ